MGWNTIAAEKIMMSRDDTRELSKLTRKVKANWWSKSLMRGDWGFLCYHELLRGAVVIILYKCFEEVRRTAKAELKREIRQELVDELTPQITKEVRVRKTKTLEKAWNKERDKQQETAARMARLDAQIFGASS